MKKSILLVLNYYYPYVSGVSEYARLVAENLVKEGYVVTVVTSNYANLKKEEYINGVHVIRTKVWLKISKGTVSPEFLVKAVQLGKKADVINLHLPMLESGVIASFLSKRNLITTFHCNVNLPHSFLNDIIVKVMDFSNSLCLKKSHKIIVTSLDYARYSRLSKKYIEKCHQAAAPIKEYERNQINYDSSYKTIGFCGRIVEEKGIDILLKAFEFIWKKDSTTRLLIGGDYENVAGGSIYPQLVEYIKVHHIQNVEFLGKIPEEDMGKFYSSLDVMVLPSTNSLEAFGMVQLEAMFCGTPVVASNLPGVRTIVQTTGMGEIAQCGDVSDLANKLEKVLYNKKEYIKSYEAIYDIYGLTTFMNRQKELLLDE